MEYPLDKLVYGHVVTWNRDKQKVMEGKNGTYSFNEYGVVGLCNGGVDGHSLFSILVAIQGVAL